MTRHDVKIEPRWFERIRQNEKFAEVRYDDRDYQTGDTIRFQRSDTDGTFHWHYVTRTITHVLRGMEAIEDGYVVLSLEDPRVAEHARTIANLRDEIDRLARSNRALRGANTRLRNAR
ncbi:RNA-binding protein [Mycobacterium phage Sneeze]|uniref:DUF3850 domain-containing protein n=2 Tax=Liefievirus TaxID=1623288 RepID=A0A481VSH4_9CAUD|nr:RNA-binding protein [Mycobacterium phage Sneeze]YP_010051256.1 RNA-binding protein [Mycobacterium phage Paito]YP_010051384.1 RNA-binding protein [Mycobacterium phage Rabbs]ANU79749.1 activating signal cointegrator-like protein [Mycobacterium phage Sneeze]AYD84624.1 hypothetical protein SEA_PAITO_39 [Mycobacterium phage Paito]QBI96792.1 hypothetical protein SEA_RABBS_39 [Mycobacterium phage Rabbs]